MAFNVPSVVRTDRYSFGPGILRIGPAGSTPTTDIGSVRSDAAFVVERETLDVNQGSPATRQKQFIISEDATFSVSGIEWDLFNLARAVGAGVTTKVGGNTDVFQFGGDPNTKSVALEFEHVLPAGTTVLIRIFTADPVGGINLEFGDDIHEFPYEFKAIESTTDWAGVALPTTGRLFEIRHQLAA